MAPDGAPDAKPFARLLVAVDGSDHGLETTRFAVSLARALGARLTLLTVYHAPSATLGEPNYSTALAHALDEARHIIERAAQVVQESGGPEPETEWLAGVPAEIIIDTAREGNYDMIVVGTHGLGRLGSAILGSVSSAVAAHAGRPVVVVSSPPSP
jgi:nucleotide-binding universal stress UspA family protein